MFNLLTCLISRNIFSLFHDVQSECVRVMKSVLFMKSVLLPFLPASASLWRFVSISFSCSSAFFCRHSRGSFSSALYHSSFSLLILSGCRSLRVSGESGRLFQCMRPDNHSAIIMSAVLPFLPLARQAEAVLMSSGTAPSFLQSDIVQRV